MRQYLIPSMKNDPTLHQFNEGLIVLIPKKTKCIKHLNDIQPIPLLNSDYKIYSSTLNFRIRPLLSTLIHPDQTGYVPKRNILENIIALDLVKFWQPNAFIALIDFTKAFDTIHHNFHILMVSTISLLRRSNYYTPTPPRRS